MYSLLKLRSTSGQHMKPINANSTVISIFIIHLCDLTNIRYQVKI